MHAVFHGQIGMSHWSASQAQMPAHGKQHLQLVNCSPASFQQIVVPLEPGPLFWKQSSDRNVSDKCRGDPLQLHCNPGVYAAGLGKTERVLCGQFAWPLRIAAEQLKASSAYLRCEATPSYPCKWTKSRSPCGPGSPDAHIHGAPTCCLGHPSCLEGPMAAW